jgi:hypothetical protein
MQLRLAAAALLVAAAAAQNTTEKQIFVWHAPHHDYLYAPLRATVLTGLRGLGVSRIHVSYEGAFDWDAIPTGSILIWLGWGRKGRYGRNRRVPWKALGGRGVYRIYYQSEPVTSLVYTKDEVDEVWDFSWHNIDKVSTHENAPILRYVPIAFLREAPLIKRFGDVPKLVFFGNAKWRPCWSDVKAMMGADLMSRYNVWNDQDYEDFLGNDYIGIFLNLHKDCGNASVANPVTWRNPKLLSSGGLVISERCYGKDELEFKGLIDFVERADIPIMFEQYVRMAPSERLRLGMKRREAFAERFDAVKIFERAGIGSLLRASSTARPADSHAPASQAAL